MKTTLRLEELAPTLAGIYALSLYNLGISAWLWVLLFFTPDLSMLGYLVNNRISAFIYNLFHHRGTALLITAIGFYFHQEVLIAIGLLLFAHASFDRIFGYGLKYVTGLKDTHLGSLEKRTTALQNTPT